MISSVNLALFFLSFQQLFPFNLAEYHMMCQTENDGIKMGKSNQLFNTEYGEYLTKIKELIIYKKNISFIPTKVT